MVIFYAAALVAAVLLTGLVFGVMNWQQTGGKILAAASGLLLLLLSAWVMIVVLLIWSADHGAPM